MIVSFWVRSCLNPEYLVTGNIDDYFGIYTVVKRTQQPGQRARYNVIETYVGDAARDTAYDRARTLQQSEGSGNERPLSERKSH